MFGWKMSGATLATILRGALFACLISACGNVQEVVSPTPLTGGPEQDSAEGTANLKTIWAEYRDAAFGYGLAIPVHWNLYPTSPNAVEGTTVIQNFTDISGRELGPQDWAVGALKIDVSVLRAMDPNQSLEEVANTYLEDEMNRIVSIQPGKIGEQDGLFIFQQEREDPNIDAPPAEPHKLFALRFPPSYVMFISVLPENGWENPDVQAILNSFVLAEAEQIELPPGSYQAVGTVTPTVVRKWINITPGNTPSPDPTSYP